MSLAQQNGSSTAPSASSSCPSSTAQDPFVQSMQHAAAVPSCPTGNVSRGKGALGSQSVSLHDMSAGCQPADFLRTSGVSVAGILSRCRS